MNLVMCGDSLQMLREVPDESVNCCVTSPPYYGLRDYGVDGQIGLESTPEQYIERLVAVFREVRRVLRDDGTLWLNLGDSYSGGSGCHAGGSDKQNSNIGATNSFLPNKSGVGLKPKDLIGIPWMLAFALRADGWYLRQDIIWAKPNPMPESVRDRCTKSHEYIFLLTKSARYWYDADATKEPIADSTINDSRLFREGYETGRPERGFPGGASHGSGLLMPKRSGNKERKQRPCADVLNIDAQAGSIPLEGLTRNKRSVWVITPKPFKGAHFAVFPPEIPRVCISAGCPIGGTVIDPFAGSGTVGMVAEELGRDSILIELNSKYIDIIQQRCKSTILY